MASTLLAMASNLVVMASTLLAMASSLVAMASNLASVVTQECILTFFANSIFRVKSEASSALALAEDT